MRIRWKVKEEKGHPREASLIHFAGRTFLHINPLKFQLSCCDPSEIIPTITNFIQGKREQNISFQKYMYLARKEYHTY